MPKVNLKFVMFIRLEDTKTMISGSGGKVSKYEKEAKKIKTKLLISPIKPDERMKIISPKHGKWISLCDDKMILYSVCLAKEYDENLGNQFLDQCRDQTKLRIPNTDKIEVEFFEENFKGTLQDLIDEYNNADNFDRLSEIHQKMSSIHNKLVEEAAERPLDTGEDVIAALERTERLVDGGKDAEVHSDLAQENARMNTRKLLFLLIVFAIVVGVVVLIGYLN